MAEKAQIHLSATQSLDFLIYKTQTKSREDGAPFVAQWLMNPTRNHEVAGSVPALAQWVNDPALP